MLSSSDNQFGFKKKSSTDMCIFAFKQVIEYYRNLSSPVYICFLDASKAFDRINHWYLFKKLLVKGLPVFLVWMLVYWFTKQEFCVRWGCVTSAFFTVSNGLRQGGILSAKFFNVYFDELSSILNNSGIGCSMSGMVINHFMYADDMAAVAPSPNGLQKLLDICQIYADKYEIKYNALKSVCLCIFPRKYKLNQPSFTLCDIKLQYVNNYKYLGYIISDSFNDQDDIKRQIRSIYIKCNMLSIKFYMCSVEVKTKLFQAYCTNFYCSQLWWDYTKQVYNKVRVAFNNGFRRFMGLSYRCSAGQMFLDSGVSHFDVLRRKAMYGFMNRLQDSNNRVICTIYNSACFFSTKCAKEWHSKLYWVFHEVAWPLSEVHQSVYVFVI